VLLNKPEGGRVAAGACPYLPAQVDTRTDLSDSGVDYVEGIVFAEPFPE
jgi:hypothetical protein